MRFKLEITVGKEDGERESEHSDRIFDRLSKLLPFVVNYFASRSTHDPSCPRHPDNAGKTS